MNTTFPCYTSDRTEAEDLIKELIRLTGTKVNKKQDVIFSGEGKYDLVLRRLDEEINLFQYKYSIPASSADRLDFPVFHEDSIESVFDCPRTSQTLIQLDTKAVPSFFYFQVVRNLSYSDAVTQSKSVKRAIQSASTMVKRRKDVSCAEENQLEGSLETLEQAATTLTETLECQDAYQKEQENGCVGLSLCENTFNKMLLDQITAVVEPLGYNSVGNTKNGLLDGEHKYSRFHSSKPDLMFASKLQHCAYAVHAHVFEEEIELTGSVTENKLPISAPIYQLLGNMEKLAGDLAYFHLRSCGKHFSKIIIYGLIIVAQSDCSKGYKLVMDFDKRNSTFTFDDHEQDLNAGLNKFIQQMKFTASKSIKSGQVPRQHLPSSSDDTGHPS